MLMLTAPHYARNYSGIMCASLEGGLYISSQSSIISLPFCMLKLYCIRSGDRGKFSEGVGKVCTSFKAVCMPYGVGRKD